MSVLVLGAGGQLGRVVARRLAQSRPVIAADVHLPSAPNGGDNTTSVILRTDATLDEQLAALQGAKKDTKVNAVINVAGGFALGNAASEDFFEASQRMMASSVTSSLLAARFAALNFDSSAPAKPLLVLTSAGAIADKASTSFAMGYGAAKAAVHQMAQDLAEPGSGLPANTSVIGIAPSVLDTEPNRAAMTKDETWIGLEDLAELFELWLDNDARRPHGIVKLSGNRGGIEVLPVFER